MPFETDANKNKRGLQHRRYEANNAPTGQSNKDGKRKHANRNVSSDPHTAKQTTPPTTIATLLARVGGEGKLVRHVHLYFFWGSLPPIQSYWSLSCDYGLGYGDEFT